MNLRQGEIRSPRPQGVHQHLYVIRPKMSQRDIDMHMRSFWPAGINGQPPERPRRKDSASRPTGFHLYRSYVVIPKAHFATRGHLPDFGI